MRSSRQYTEKRNYMRLTMDCPVSYQVVNTSNRRMGTCRNLSADGILFECDEKYPIGTRIKVNVSPTLSLSPPFSAVVKVVRVSADDEGDSYQLAGTLEDIH